MAKMALMSQQPSKLGKSKTSKAEAVPSAPPVDPTMGPSDDYETRNHLRTLMEAEDIKGDPSKMKRVHALAGRHQKALKSIKSVSDLKDLYDQKFGKGALKGDKSKIDDTDKDGM
jgi:hypothetical protein